MDLRRKVVTFQSSLPTSLKVSLCSEFDFLEDESNRFLFIMDMSRSNIGNFTERRQDHYYWDPSLGEDSGGDRFEAVKQFITSCASSSNNKFAIIGFAKSAGIPLYDDKRRAYLDCSNPVSYTDGVSAVNEVERFKRIHGEETRYYEQWINDYYNEEPRFSDKMIYTSYASATKCANKVIHKDILDSYDESIDNYHIIFISDGKPSEDPESEKLCREVLMETPQGEKECIKSFTDPLKESIFDLLAIRRKVNILAVGYGSGLEGSYRYLDAISGVDGQGQAERLDDFKENGDVFCQLVSSRFGIEVHSDSLTSVVLTINQRNGIYKSDSDMDGLLDELEEGLGYDPKSPRSQVDGILDGLCEKLGGVTVCNQEKEQVQCDPGLFVSSGFSDCDIKVIKNHWRSLNLDNSPDWDKDGIPNFIEIVKGTNPFIDDMSEDPDNDSLTTKFEIIRSKNPFEHESLTPEKSPQVGVANQWVTSSPQCDRVRNLLIDEIPVVESILVEGEVHGDLLHDEGGHIMAVFSSRKSQNYVLQDRGLVGKFIKFEAKEEGGKRFLVPSVNELKNEDFSQWEQ